jgi:hypothetical protein
VTQLRYFDFGVEATAAAFKEMLAGLTGRGVLSGGELGVAAPDRLIVQPVWLVLDSPRATAYGNERANLLLHETEPRQLIVPITTGPQVYTVMYRHDDVDAEGGEAARLTLEPGALINQNQTNGTVLGYVVYPGGAVQLTQAMVVPAPRDRVQAIDTPGSGQYVTPPGTGMSWVHTGGNTPVVETIDDPAFGQCTHVDNRTNATPTIDLLRWTFVVPDGPPGSVSIDYVVETGQTIALDIRDTGGNSSVSTLPAISPGTLLGSMLVQDFPDVTVESTGPVKRRRLRIANGTYQSGRRFTIQATVQTAAGRRTIVTAVGHSRYRAPIAG